MQKVSGVPNDYARARLGLTVSCDSCGQENLQEELYFHHCGQCKYDLCSKCDSGLAASDKDGEGGFELIELEDEDNISPCDNSYGMSDTSTSSDAQDSIVFSSAELLQVNPF